MQQHTQFYLSLSELCVHISSLYCRSTGRVVSLMKVLLVNLAPDWENLLPIASYGTFNVLSLLFSESSLISNKESASFSIIEKHEADFPKWLFFSFRSYCVCRQRRSKAPEANLICINGVNMILKIEHFHITEVIS